MVILLIQKILSLFMVMFLGFLIVKLGLLKAEDSRIISVVVVYLVTPCCILNSFQVDLTPEITEGLLLALIGAVISMGLLMGIVTLLGQKLRLNAVESMSILYSNCGNLIIPLVGAMLGSEWVIYSTAYMAVQNLFLWSHCKSVMSGEKSISIQKIVKNVNMIAIFFGLLFLFTGVRFTGPIATTISDMGSMIGTLSMLVSGMLIGGLDLKKMVANRRLWMVTAFRLVLVPLIFLLPIRFAAAHVPVTNAKSILLITYLAIITPSASTVMQQAQVYGKDSDYAGAINMVTTLCCIITMPIMVMLYQM